MSTPEINRQSLAVVGSAFLAATLAGLLVANTAITVFMNEIATDYGWSHAGIGAAVTALFIGMGVGAPLFGRVVDRHGPRRVLLPLTFLSGLLLVSFSVIGPSLILFYLAHFLLGVATPGAVAYSKLISTWFFRRRAMALTALGAGSFVGSVSVPPIAHWLMLQFGWQSAYLVFGLAELLIAFPVLLFFFRERPLESDESGVVSNEIQPDGAPHIGVLDALKNKTYWLVTGAQIAGFFVYLGFGTHALGILTQRGLDPAAATLGISVLAAGGLLAQIATGVLLDKFDTPHVIAPFALLSVVSLALLYLSQGIGVIAFLFLFGVGCGGQISMTSYFTTRYFGVRNFSTIYGSIMPILLLSSAPAPILIGALFDRTGSYDGAFIVLEAVLVASAALFLLLEPYSYPVRKRAAAEARLAPLSHVPVIETARA